MFAEADIRAGVRTLFQEAQRRARRIVPSCEDDDAKPIAPREERAKKDTTKRRIVSCQGERG